MDRVTIFDYEQPNINQSLKEIRHILYKIKTYYKIISVKGTLKF